MDFKTKSIVGMVCGIVSIVFSFIPYVCIISLVPAIVAIVFAAGGMKAPEADGNTRGMAIAGLVCGIVGVVFALPGTICGICTICVAANSNAIANELQNALSTADFSAFTN
ncbi:MAG: DUF4190 domain-containing protein [Ruminiclostridium sp.]|nr:DUF4190 domain-containing protein [Ruminiclostridium sp.]